MNSHTHIQNTLNHPPLQPYPIKIETEHKVEVGTRTKKTPKKTSQLPAAKRLANTKKLNYQQWLEVRKQGIGSSDAATACGLNPYMSMGVDDQDRSDAAKH